MSVKGARLKAENQVTKERLGHAFAQLPALRSRNYFFQGRCQLACVVRRLTSRREIIRGISPTDERHKSQDRDYRDVPALHRVSLSLARMRSNSDFHSLLIHRHDQNVRLAIY